MKKNSRSLKTNAIYNILRTASSIVFPLITFPYISRILSVNNLGKVNYGLSIITYFSLLARLGIPTYAVREGARLREDNGRIEQFASEVFSINIFTTMCSYVLLFVLLLTVPNLKNYQYLILIQSASIYNARNRLG